jgi:hypothetical protein
VLDAAALAIAREIGMTALANEIEPAAAQQPSAQPMTLRVERASFTREGDYWSVAFGTESFRIRDSKGMRHLARLLRSPGTELHALDLVHADGPVTPAAAGADRELAVGDLSDTGPQLDAQAKAAYRERLLAIDEERAEAERWNDPERVTLLDDERSALIRELSAAMGLGGRDRVSSSSSAERARVSVTRAVRAAMERIAEYSPMLGAHLDATIRTGTFCAYVPDPRLPIEWTT